MAEVAIDVVEGIAWLASKDKRVKIAVGGRGSGKSTGVSDLMLAYANAGQRICCAREFQNSIDDSVHQTLIDEIERLGLDGYTASKTDITAPHGGRLFYKGLARNITSVKSIHGIDKLWIEEGESTSSNSLKILTPSIRSTAGSDKMPEIWITMNRGSSKDAISQKYLARAEKDLAKTGKYEDDLMMVAQVNYEDNPWFPTELELERLDCFHNMPKSVYDHIWLGEYNDSVENSIIKPEWFDACVDAHIKLGFKPLGIEVVAHDPSDTGSDSKGLAHRHGSVLIQAIEKDTGDINEGGDWAADYAIQNAADVFIYDCDGMGVGLKRQFADAFRGKRIKVEAYRGSNSPDNPDEIYDSSSVEHQQKTNAETFRNKRAQAYWLMRDRVYRTWQAVTKGVYHDPGKMVSFSKDIENLELFRSELCRIPLKSNGMGLIQICTKPEMKKLGIDSPNIADSAVMAFMAEVKPVQARARRVVVQPSGGWT